MAHDPQSGRSLARTAIIALTYWRQTEESPSLRGTRKWGQYSVRHALLPKYMQDSIDFPTCSFVVPLTCECTLSGATMTAYSMLATSSVGYACGVGCKRCIRASSSLHEKHTEQIHALGQAKVVLCRRWQESCHEYVSKCVANAIRDKLRECVLDHCVLVL